MLNAKKIMRQAGRELITWLVLAVLIWLAFSYYAHGDGPWLFYNSDNGIPAIYQDVMQHGGHFMDWEWAAVMNFFPDLTLFFGLSFLSGGDVKTAILLFGVIQLCLYYLLTLAIARLVVDQQKSIVFFKWSILFSIYLLSTGAFFHREIFESALTAWLHFGAALMYLAGTFLVLLSFKRSSGFVYTTLFIVTLLSGYSDLLFIVQFAAPALMALWLLRPYCDAVFQRVCLVNAVIIAAASGAAYFIYRLNPIGLHIHLETKIIRRKHVEDVAAAILKLRDVLSGFFQQNPVVMLMLGVFILGCVMYLYRARKSFSSSNPVKKPSFLFVMILFACSMLIGLISLLLLDNDLMESGYIGMRHYQTFILFPVFIGIPMLLSLSPPLVKLADRGYLYVVWALAALGLSRGEWQPISSITNFYPPSVACLDSYASSHHLRHGLANYWQAKSYTYLSKKGLHVVAMTQHFMPYRAISSANHFRDKTFNFVIVPADKTDSPSYPSGLHEDAFFNTAYLQQFFGSPSEVLTCPSALGDGQDKIYVYPEGVINAKWASA